MQTKSNTTSIRSQKKTESSFMHIRIYYRSLMFCLIESQPKITYSDNNINDICLEICSIKAIGRLQRLSSCWYLNLNNNTSDYPFQHSAAQTSRNSDHLLYSDLLFRLIYIVTFIVDQTGNFLSGNDDLGNSKFSVDHVVTYLIYKKINDISLLG